MRKFHLLFAVCTALVAFDGCAAVDEPQPDVVPVAIYTPRLPNGAQGQLLWQEGEPTPAPPATQPPPTNPTHPPPVYPPVFPPSNPQPWPVPPQQQPTAAPPGSRTPARPTPPPQQAQQPPQGAGAPAGVSPYTAPVRRTNSFGGFGYNYFTQQQQPPSSPSGSSGYGSRPGSSAGQYNAQQTSFFGVQPRPNSPPPQLNFGLQPSDTLRWRQNTQYTQQGNAYAQQGGQMQHTSSVPWNLNQAGQMAGPNPNTFRQNNRQNKHKKPKWFKRH